MPIIQLLQYIFWKKHAWTCYTWVWLPENAPHKSSVWFQFANSISPSWWQTSASSPSKRKACNGVIVGHADQQGHVASVAQGQGCVLFNEIHVLENSCPWSQLSLLSAQTNWTFVGILICWWDQNVMCPSTRLPGNIPSCTIPLVYSFACERT